MKLLKALQEIAEGLGPYSTDRLKHAENTIESMKAIATKAIEAHESCDHKWEAPPHPDELLICAKCDREMWTDDES